MIALTDPRTRDARILVVDDQDANVVLLQRILERAGYRHIQVTTDGRGASGMFMDFKPDLVLLDLHMPGVDGFDILSELAPLVNDRAHVPVLMLTGDTRVEAKHRALSLGAKDFLAKPFDATEVLLRIRNLLETRYLYRSLEKQNASLEIKVQERTGELEESQIEIIERLARSAELRDNDTGRHTKRVGELSGRLASALGLNCDTVEVIRRAAPLHDLGKIGIPDSILLKPGKLTVEEMAIMRRHTIIGAELLSGGQSELVMVAERIALGHHEHWNGKGYPHNRAGEQIPIEARIVAVADCFDALTHSRPYRTASSVQESLDYLERNSGTHFDPVIISSFVGSRCYAEFKPSPALPFPAFDVSSIEEIKERIRRLG